MCLSYLGLWAWEECVAFVRQTRYTNSWLTWALTRKKVELLLWANILNSCSAALTKRREKNLFWNGWGSSPWICEGRRCHTREEHLPTEQTHIRVSCRLRAAEKHEDETDKSTNIRMGHTNSDSWAWPKDICSPRAEIGCERSAWLQWKCQEFVQRQEWARVPHLQRAAPLERIASPYSAATPPCIWRGEVGWGARPAAATSHPLVTDHLFSPHSEHQVVHSEHQHMWMLHLPSLHCQRTDTDATTLPFPAALACAAGLLLACVCTSHMMISAPFVESNSHPAGSNVIYQPDFLFFVFCNDTFGPSPVCTAVWYSS